MMPEQVPLPLAKHKTFAPILRSDALWSASVRASAANG
jgi:hypothetical protein